MSRRVALVTGATGAIGEAIARQLACDHDHDVILACRDAKKAARAVAAITEAAGNAAARAEIVDLSSPASIRALAGRLEGPLHLLVNNAADTPRRRRLTADGIEVQLATNVLGYYWMIEALGASLAQSAPARVVNVASYWAGGLDLDDLQFERRPYDNDTAYRQSKQANRMLTVPLAERLAPDGITVNVCHPGDVSSALSNSLGFGGHETPDQGARTPVWVATSPELASVTGKYFEQQRERPCRFASDRQAIDELVAACERLSAPHR